MSVRRRVARITVAKSGRDCSSCRYRALAMIILWPRRSEGRSLGDSYSRHVAKGDRAGLQAT